MENRQTNREYAKENPQLKRACAKVEIPVTKRQASKFRMGKGLAYKNGRRFDT